MNYTQIDTHLHSICQILAKCGRTFVNAEKDDSHTNIAYDPIGDRLVGRWFDTPEGPALPVIYLDDLSFQLMTYQQKSILEVSAFGRTQKSFEKEIALAMDVIGVTTDGLTAAMDYSIPNYGFEDKPLAILIEDELDAWRVYRSQANTMCEAILGHLQAKGEVRIWPKHFDTGIYMEVSDRLAIGFGLAMDDEYAGMPYYYAAGYRGKDPLDYSKADQLTYGQWNYEDGFKGALLPGDEPPEAEVLDLFVREVLTWLLEQ